MSTTRIYLNQRAFADAAGFHDIQAGEVAIHKLAKAGHLPHPDITVGKRLGWLPDRVRLFGDLYRTGGIPATGEAPGWWAPATGETEDFLGLKPISTLLGVAEITLIKRIKENRFVPAAVAITRDGTPAWGTPYGWRQPDVEEYGRQYGWLDADNQVADIRRGGAVRKTFRTPQAA